MPQKVDFMAYEGHFMDHLAPMFHALPASYQGKFLIRNALVNKAKALQLPFIKYGPQRKGAIEIMAQRQNLMVCAASGDLKTAHRAGAMAVFTQHGGGQSFTKLHSSYAGWPNHRNVAMFLHPGDHPAARDDAAYKGRKPVRIVGCPKMDPWHSGQYEQPQNELPVVVFSTHWDCKVVPETRSAFWHMLPGLQQLARLNGQEFILKGHGHPRILRQVIPEYRSLGIEVIRSFDQVMHQADLYIMDHMSTLYEFASAGPGGHGRPVVVMNMPGYRRHVNHGLRFWDAAHVGINVDAPDQLVDGVRRALLDEPEQRRARLEAVQLVYKFTDGGAAQRAAAAIVEAANRHKPIRRQSAHRVIKQPKPKNEICTTYRKNQLLPSIVCAMNVAATRQLAILLSLESPFGLAGCFGRMKTMHRI